MRKFRLLMVFLSLLGGVISVKAQTDVTATYLKNADFASGEPIDNGVCTYGADMDGNHTTYHGPQAIPEWTNASVGYEASGYANCALASGVFAYGGTPWLAGSGNVAPATGPDGNAGQAAGLCAVWSASIQYTQAVELPAGSYTIRFKVYNTTTGNGNSSGVINADLFGFVENGGTTHYAPNNTFAIGQWSTVAVSFTLKENTAGKISMGYAAANAGSGAMPHLFVDNVQILMNSKVKDCTDMVNATGWEGVNDGYQGGAINTARQYGDKSVGRHMYQTVAGLDKGTYELALYCISQKEWNGTLAKDAGDVAYVFADNGKYELKEWVNARARAGYPGDENLGIYTISGVEVTEDGTLTIGMGLNKADLAEWHHIQIKSLVRTNIDLSDLVKGYLSALSTAKEIAAKTDKMATASRQNVIDAIDTYDEGKVDKGDADALETATESLEEAVKKANISLASYATIANGSIPNDKLDGWVCENTNTFHINTWSTEGGPNLDGATRDLYDGTGMVVPFIENWVAKGSYLGAGKVYYKLEGLEPGETFYAQALVRSYNEKDSNAPNGPNFFINDVTTSLSATGTTFPYSGMSGIFATLGNTATIGSDGTLKLGVDIANDRNYNWVAFKDVRIMTIPDAIAYLVNEAEALSDRLYSSDAKAILKSAIDANQSGTDEVAIKNLREAMGRAVIANRVTFTGSYYVQNAESGKYMAAGHDWGTRGIVNVTGLDLTLAANNTTRTVTFDSQVSNGGDSHFFGSNLYMDGGAFGWIIEQMGEDTYSISNGGQYVGVDADDNLVMTNTPVAWKFRTFNDRIADLAEASGNNGVDATFLLKDPNFGRNDLRVSAWTQTGVKELSGGNNVNNCAESYHSAFNISQTVKGAPTGIYQLKAQGFYSPAEGTNEDAPLLYINDESVLLLKKTGSEGSMEAVSESFSNGLYDEKSVDCKVTGDITVGIRGTATQQWVIFDNFRLTYYGPIPADESLMEPVLATANKLAADDNKTEGKEDLNKAITAASAAYFNSNSYTYDDFKAEVDKLQTAIDAFRKLYNVAFNGEYYIQNATSGKYMAAGHDWGTRGIVNEMGLNLTLAADKNTNKVSFDSQVSNGGNSHFLNEGLYMDGAADQWYVEKMDDDTYTISNNNGPQYIGVDDNDNLVLVGSPVAWKFVKAADVLAARMATMENATPDNGVDVTFLLKNPNFNRNDQRVSGWAVSEDCTNKNLNGGNNLNNCAESYHSTFTISQTLNSVPDGVYGVKAQGFFRQDGTNTEAAPTFFINDATQAIALRSGSENSMSEASESFTEGKYDMTNYLKCTVSNGTLTVGVKGTATSQWVIFDNFRLIYYGPDKGKLGDLLATAKELAADVNKPEGKEALNTAIASAQTVYDSSEAPSLSAFEAEVKNLEEAIEAFKKTNRTPFTGVYYVQNATSGMYMSAGHNWGTRAIVDETGLDLTLKADSKTNEVTFESQVFNGQDKHFLNDGLYMDGATYNWSIGKMSGDTYNISDGKKFIGVDKDNNLTLVDSPVAWKFVTVADRKASLDEATADDPVDATFLLKGSNFGRNNQRVKAWEQTGVNNLSGGNDVNNCAESFHSPFTLSQTLSEMPIGIYELKVQGFYRQDGDVSEDAPVFFMNSETQPVSLRTGTENDMKAVSEAFTAGLYDMEEPITCTVNDGTIKVGIKGTAENQWVIFDNFRLLFYGLAEEDITEPPVAHKDLVYTGEPQVLITAGSHEVGQVQYSTDKENWSTELPTATNAGTHSVWYRVVDENNMPLLSVKRINIRIAPASVPKLFDVKIAETEYTYDGTAKEPEVTVTGGIGKLTEGTDYVISYEDNTHAGTAKAVVTGQGNYGGMIALPFNIAKLQLTSFVLTDTLLVFNEKEQVVGADSVMAGEMMVPADAYTLSGNAQAAVGIYTVTLTANDDSNFDGELTAEFEIIGSPIDVCDMTLETYQFIYNGKENKPGIIAMLGDVQLTEGVDYTISFADNINAGTATAIIHGIGNYSGTKEAQFTITQGQGSLDMLNKEVSVEYGGTPLTVKPIVLLGDGTIRYTSSNEAVASVNYYTGEVTVNSVGQTTITIKMSSTPNATAASTSYVLTVTPADASLVNMVRLGVGYGMPSFQVSTYRETLVEGKDYTLSFRDPQGHAVTESDMLAAPGTYVAVATLKGNFEGTCELEFTVLEMPTGIGTVNGDGSDGPVRYDMQGRRVQKSHRGMVIENGKKRYIKK